MQTPAPANHPNQGAALFERLRPFALSVLTVALLTGALALFRGRLNPSTLPILFLIPVVFSTTLWGLWAGVLSAFAGFLVYNYFFIPPYNTLLVHQSQDIVALLIFLVAAVFISQLIGQTRSSLAAAVARESETTRLYELSLGLAGVNSAEELAGVLGGKIEQVIPGVQVELVLRAADGQAFIHQSFHKDAGDQAGPDALIPLETARAAFGEMRLWLGERQPTQAEERLLRAFAAQSALALERTALADAENQARVLAESDRLKSALLSSVSHELRTPIATIKAASTSLLNDEITWDPDARADLLSAIDEEADTLNYLVGNLLDMSRIEAGALKPNRQWNVLAEILDGVLQRMHRRLARYQLDVRIPDDLPMIQVDYSQMEQVLTNLLNNSAKYAPEETTIQVEACTRGEDEVMVKVKNEGPQVIAEHLERIFDRFYRVTDPERVTGAGLGLSICKGIIAAHGGRIWAENVPGGLAFVFTLPRALESGRAPLEVEA